MSVLYLIIPCCNEEAVLPVTGPMFLQKLCKLIESGLVEDTSRILFIDDGSKDGTWAWIQKMAKQQEQIRGISLSRNRGHQNALLAGLMTAVKDADITITVDCDGQDDLDAMDEMIQAYQKGSDIVYGVRSSRIRDSLPKRMTAELFYRLLRMLGADIVFNHADYRLMSRRAVEALADFSEVNLFLRGLVPLIGFPHSFVYYERRERLAGKSRYSLVNMIRFALDGITSLSVRPIRLITAFGGITSLFGFGGIVWAILRHFAGETVSGWASIVCIICFMGGVQMLSLGVIGEYIGKIYLETKRRPPYIVAEKTWEERTHKQV